MHESHQTCPIVVRMPKVILQQVILQPVILLVIHRPIFQVIFQAILQVILQVILPKVMVPQIILQEFIVAQLSQVIIIPPQHGGNQAPRFTPPSRVRQTHARECRGNKCLLRRCGCTN